MSKANKLLTCLGIIFLLVIIGNIAQGFNESHHYEMALEVCGSKDNIANYDENGFRCKQGPSEKLP